MGTLIVQEHRPDAAGEIAAQWKTEIEAYRGRAEEMAQRLEKQAGDLRRELASQRLDAFDALGDARIVGLEARRQFGNPRFMAIG